MPVIKPRTRGKELIRHITRLDRLNLETLFAYAHFIGEAPEYVLNQLVESVLAKDKEFAAWRGQNSESFVPKTPQGARAKRRRASARTEASLTHQDNAPLSAAVGRP